MPELFTAIAPPPRRRGLVWLVNGSLAVHVALGAALVLVPLYFSGQVPVAVGSFGPIIVVPAPPPPPPPPPAPRSSAQARSLTRQAVVPPQPSAFTAPREVPKADPRPAEPAMGLDLGDENGVLEGMDGGVAGGMPGGVPGGVVGGVPGGVGDGPALDYDQPPRLLRMTKPEYPKEAFIKKIEGVVELAIVIDAKGEVADARVTRSIPLLDTAAIQCVRQWRFSPALKNGRPVAAYANAPIRFSLL